MLLLINNLKNETDSDIKVKKSKSKLQEVSTYKKSNQKQNI